MRAVGRLAGGLDHRGVFERGVGAGGEGDGGGEDHGSAEPGAGAEVLVEEKDAEERADEGFHVEQDSGLRCGDLGHAPVPEQSGGGGAEQAAGGEGGPGFERDAVDGRRPVGEGNVDAPA